MPPEPPCVWSTAGVLEYRPCGREYECDACPLYQALRGGGAPDAGEATAPCAAIPGDEAVEQQLALLGSGCTLRLDRAYSADGLWMAGGPAGTLELGLDDYTLRLLQPVDDVVLPRAGARLRRGSACAWVNRGKLAISLRAPIACEVIAVHPHPVLEPPAAGGKARERWWLRVAPREPVAGTGVYRQEALLGWYLGRVRAVRDQLHAVMAESGCLGGGRLLADGGLPAPDLEAVLGRERFEALVGALFPLHI